MDLYVGDGQQSPGSHDWDVDLFHSTNALWTVALHWSVEQHFVCLGGVLHMVANSFRTWVKIKMSRTPRVQFSFAVPQEAQLLMENLTLFLKQNLLLGWVIF